MHDPRGSPESSIGKGVAAGGLVSEFKAFTVIGIDDCVVSHDIPASKGMHANFIFCSRTDYTFSTMFQLVLQGNTPCLRKDFSKSHRSATGCIPFHAVMHLDNLKVKGSAQYFSGH